MVLMTSHIQSENTDFALAYRLFVGGRTAIKSDRDKIIPSLVEHSKDNAFDSFIVSLQ